jgi:glycosyltransferase involved in cell wall biosynthesis
MAGARKIILLTHEFAPFRGGVATYCEEVARAGARLGYPVEVWTQEGAKPHNDAEFPFQVWRAPGGGTLRPGDLFSWFCSLWNRESESAGVRFILASVGSQMVMMHLRELGLYRKAELIPVLHGSEINRFSQNFWLRSLARNLFFESAKIAAASWYPQRLFADSVFGEFKEKVVVAPLGLRQKFIERWAEAIPPVGRKDEKLRVLTVARIHPRKGQRDVAEALGLLPESWKKRVIYQICGRGDASYAQEIRESCRRGGVTLEEHGEVTNELLDQLYGGCDIFVQASRTLAVSVEGFGMTYLEAGTFGKAVVGYASGGAVDAVLDGVTGLLVPEGDQAGLARAIERLLGDEALRQQLGAAGRARALRFNYDEAARVLLGEPS